MAEKDERPVEFGNLICRFGEQYVLLDLFSHVIWPAFTNGSVRTYDRTSFIFQNVRLHKIEQSNGDTPLLALSGRLIKDTTLERDQVYKDGKLQEDHSSLQSSPSSIFTLILNNHRLIFLKETRFAPSMSEFRGTFQYLVKKRRSEYIDELYEAAQAIRDENDGLTVTKKELNAAYPVPTIKLVPMTSKQSFSEFVNQYEQLRKISIRIVDSNHEMDMSGFFKKMRSSKTDLGSTSTVLTHSNPKGLDKKETINQLDQQVAEANVEIKLQGYDSDGDKLNGNNQDFQVKSTLEKPSRDVVRTGTRMVSLFVGFLEKGIISLPKASIDVSKKIKALIEKHNP